MATAAVTQARLDRVIFLPARISPHKDTQTPGASPEDRLEMLKLATAGIPWAEVSDWEISRPPPSYSWNTALHFRDLYPESHLLWILGADQWSAIESWAHPDLLQTTLDFLVVARPGYPAPKPLPGWRSRVIDLSHPASATAIREAHASGGTAGDVPDAVTAYIARRGLYRRDNHAL